MSHHANYIKEREGFETLENEFGFFEYRIHQDDCYIRTMYIAPDYRGKGIAKNLAEQVIQIAKSRNCKTITGTVVPDLNPEMATESLAMQIKFGFKLSSAHENFIILKKEI